MTLMHRIAQEVAGRQIRRAVVKRVHRDRVDVKVGNSPRYLRGLRVIGSMANLSVGSTVLVERHDGEYYVHTFVTG